MSRRLFMLLLLAAPASAETLTLQQAVATGVRTHPTVEAASAQSDAARARVGEAFSYYLPSLGFAAVGSVDYANAPVTNAGVLGGQTGGFAGFARYRGNLILQQTIYDFGRTRWAVAAARRSAEASSADRETARLTVELNVVNAYYQVLQAIALQKVAEDAVAQAEQHLAQANALFKIGTRPEIDVASAESQAAQARLQLVHARNAISIAKVTLNAAMGVDRDTGYDLAPQPAEAVPGEAEPLDALVAEAIKSRPEYESLRRQVEAADAQVHLARAGYYPTLAAAGSITANGTDTAPTPSLDFGAQLNLTLPIFNGLLTRRTVEENQAQARAARANLEGLALAVRQNVATAALGVRESLEAVDAARALERQADRQLAMATGRYQGGVGNIIELVDAQAGDVSARAQRVQSEYTLATSRAQLQRALGRPVVAHEVNR